MKGLMGDSSDNIPGIAGVGEKTAIKLLNQFDSVENLYNHLDEVSGKKLKEKLENGHDDALMSKELATINRESPIEVTLEETKLPDEVDQTQKIELFKELDFKQMLNQIDVDADTETESDRTYDIETDFNAIDFDQLKQAALHFEVDEGDYLTADILKFGFKADEHFVVINADEIQNYPELIKWLEDEQTEKYVYDAKKTYAEAHRMNIDIKNITFDIMLASYILNPSRSIDDVHSVVVDYGQGYVPEAVPVSYTHLTLPTTPYV